MRSSREEAHMSQLYVQTDGVRSYAQVHDHVAAVLSQMMGAAAPEATDLQASHGPIAAAVGTALSNVLATRHGTLQTTATSGTTISDLLQKAAQMYEQGDRQGAEKLTAAAEALQAHEGEQGSAEGVPGGGVGGLPGGAGAVAPGGGVGSLAGGGAGSPAGSGAGGGAAMVGQMLGQVGQQVGQLGSQLTQPLSGLAQGLQQIPQQIMQAVQGAGGVAGNDKAGSHVTDGVDRTKEPSDRPEEPSEPKSPQDAEPAPADDHARSEAAPGESTSGGRAPELPAAARPQPAQTRPQDD
jgi:uncharacterized phage infection (PIP) family protein YhgE